MDKTEVPESGNDLTSPLGAFCLDLDRSWRGEGDLAILSAADMRDRFFPLKGDTGYEDRAFLYFTPEERAELVFGWHLCGKRMAVGYDAAKIASIVHDAFRAGDLNEAMFAEAVGPRLLLTRVPLGQWWEFYRSGRHCKASVLHLLKSANWSYDLFDGPWFFKNLVVHTKTGVELRGIEGIGAALNKGELVNWLMGTHSAIVAEETVDEDDLLRALTLDKVVEKLDLADLLLLTDALARKLGLTEEPKEVVALGPLPAQTADEKLRDATADTIEAPPASSDTEPAAATIDAQASETVIPEPPTSDRPKPTEKTRRSQLPAFFTPPPEGEEDGRDDEIDKVISKIEPSQPGVEKPTATGTEISESEAVVDDIAFDAEEQPSRQSPTVEVKASDDDAADVSEEELLAANSSGNGEEIKAGELVLTGPPKGIDWGQHAPDPAASAAAARERIAGNDSSRSGSSVNRAPTPDSQRAVDATAPSVPPAAEPAAQPSASFRRVPPPFPKGHMPPRPGNRGKP